MHENLIRIKAVHQVLKGLEDDYVFVGGATVSLYATDSSLAAEIRPTDDVDIVMELPPQPKYLFRGKRLAEWKTSKSTFSRNLYEKPIFPEINRLVTGIHLSTFEIIHDFSLYLFLREALWNNTISPDVKTYLTAKISAFNN